MREIAHQNVYSATFFLGSSNAPQPRPPNRFLTHNTSNDVVPRKGVPFRGLKTKI